MERSSSESLVQRLISTSSPLIGLNKDPNLDGNSLHQWQPVLTTQFRFLHLPLELRDKVYDYIRPGCSPASRTRGDASTLLVLCHQVKSEYIRNFVRRPTLSPSYTFNQIDGKLASCLRLLSRNNAPFFQQMMVDVSDGNFGEREFRALWSTVHDNHDGQPIELRIMTPCPHYEEHWFEGRYVIKDTEPEVGVLSFHYSMDKVEVYKKRALGSRPKVKEVRLFLCPSELGPIKARPVACIEEELRRQVRSDRVQRYGLFDDPTNAHTEAAQIVEESRTGRPSSLMQLFLRKVADGAEPDDLRKPGETMGLA
ncbi:MAG: hypothetical protein M1820_005983 [Bogoriella megaspora]|nr:MAG: hypothetical protein M1820_005983 [Bogoriella megaspora]